MAYPAWPNANWQNETGRIKRPVTSDRMFSVLRYVPGPEVPADACCQQSATDQQGQCLSGWRLPVQRIEQRADSGHRCHDDGNDIHMHDLL